MSVLSFVLPKGGSRGVIITKITLSSIDRGTSIRIIEINTLPNHNLKNEEKKFGLNVAGRKGGNGLYT